MAKNEIKKESKLIRFIKAPIRVLSKAGDCYMKSMNQIAGKVEQGGVIGGAPTAQISTLPKSFSVSSAKSCYDDDLTDLIRVASTRSLENKVQVEILKQQKPAAAAGEVVPRSQSVAIGRIDEDKSCDFDNDMFKVNMDVFPRSKSHAVSTSRKGLNLPSSQARLTPLTKNVGATTRLSGH